MSTITKASIYEIQGYKEEALEIYKDILRQNPYDKEAKLGIKRIKGLSYKACNCDEKMLDLFNALDDEDKRKRFETWLIKI